MGIAIRRIARDDGSALMDMYRVCQKAGFTSPIEKLRSNWLLSSQDTVCYGAYVDERLVGINMFIPHKVLLAGVRSRAYQSTWSAIDPEYREKGVFLRLVLEARKDFTLEAATLIFGFANALSQQAYSHKFFQKVSMHRSLIFAIQPRFLRTWQFDSDSYFGDISSPNVLKFDQHENFVWKNQEYPDIVAIEHYKNFLWGRVIQQKISPFLSLPALMVGGCEINKPQLFVDLIWKLRQQHGVKLVRFTSTVNSLLAPACRLGLDGSKTEPLIYMPIAKLPTDLRMDAHVGLKDAF